MQNETFLTQDKREVSEALQASINVQTSISTIFKILSEVGSREDSNHPLYPVIIRLGKEGAGKMLEVVELLKELQAQGVHMNEENIKSWRGLSLDEKKKMYQDGLDRYEAFNASRETLEI